MSLAARAAVLAALVACEGKEPLPDFVYTDTGPSSTDTDLPPTTDTGTGGTGDTGGTTPTDALPRWVSATERCGNALDDDADALVDEDCEPAAWAGVFVPDPAVVAQIEVDTGPLPVIQTYRSTTAAGAANLAADLDRIYGDARVAHVYVEPSGYSALQYADSATDATVGADLQLVADTVADGLVAWPEGRMLLSFGAEMNGDWTDWGCLPVGTFVAFHERFHGLVDDALAARGLDPRRVRWVFAPDSRGSGGCPAPSAYWPGDLDLAGLSAYRSGTESVTTTVLDPADLLMDGIGWSDTDRRGRFVVLQTGSRDADRAAFSAELYAAAVTDPAIAGVIWFDAADWAVHDGTPRVDYAHWAAAVAGLPAADPELEGIFDPWFRDVPRDHTRYAEIQALRSAGHTSGCAAARFCPADPLRRADAAVLLSRVFALPDAPEAFDDVDGAAAGAIGAVSGALPGCSATAFCPDAPVTRHALALAVARLAGAPPADAAWDDLADPELGALLDAGWIDSCAPGRFCPDDPATRADGAAWMVHAAVAPASAP